MATEVAEAGARTDARALEPADVSGAEVLPPDEHPVIASAHAATTAKPSRVIVRAGRTERTESSNVMRGIAFCRGQDEVVTFEK